MPPYILRYWYLWLIYALASVVLAVNMIYSFGFHDSWIRYKQTVVKQFEIQEPCIYWKYFIRGDAVGRRLYISMFHDVWVLTLVGLEILEHIEFVFVTYRFGNKVV